jgi:hypothetical protein
MREVEELAMLRQISRSPFSFTSPVRCASPGALVAPWSALARGASCAKAGAAMSMPASKAN